MLRFILNSVLLFTFLFASSANLHRTDVKFEYPEGYHYFHTIYLNEPVESIDTIIHPLVFSKDHDYEFIVQSELAVVTVEIRDDLNRIVATNYDRETKTYFERMVFECHISEIYKISITANNLDKHGVVRIFSKSHNS